MTRDEQLYASARAELVRAIFAASVALAHVSGPGTFPALARAIADAERLLAASPAPARWGVFTTTARAVRVLAWDLCRRREVIFRRLDPGQFLERCGKCGQERRAHLDLRLCIGPDGCFLLRQRFEKARAAA